MLVCSTHNIFLVIYFHCSLCECGRKKKLDFIDFVTKLYGYILYIFNDFWIFYDFFLRWVIRKSLMIRTKMRQTQAFRIKLCNLSLKTDESNAHASNYYTTTRRTNIQINCVWCVSVYLCVFQLTINLRRRHSNKNFFLFCLTLL